MNRALRDFARFGRLYLHKGNWNGDFIALGVPGIVQLTFFALVLLGGLAIHTAVATSLVIIALKSFSGFYKYMDVLEQHNLELVA